MTITVDAVNDAPVAVDDSYATDEDTPLTVAAPGVLGNDTDVDGDPLTRGAGRPVPANGTLTLNADGTFTYTPNANFNGSDSFTYKANDGTVDSNVATVTITVDAVNDAPVALDDSVRDRRRHAADGRGAGRARQRHRRGRQPADGSRWSTGPANGTLALNANGSLHLHAGRRTSTAPTASPTRRTTGTAGLATSRR